jgi:hypothetical protein
MSPPLTAVHPAFGRATTTYHSRKEQFHSPTTQLKKKNIASNLDDGVLHTSNAN